MTHADHLSIEIPGHAAHILTARQFAGLVGRHYGCDEDLVEEIKIVVSEACSSAILRDDLGDLIRVEAAWSDGTLSFVIQPVGDLRPHRTDLPSADQVDAVNNSSALIWALFPDVQLGDRDGVAYMRFSVNATGTAPRSD